MKDYDLLSSKTAASERLRASFLNHSIISPLSGVGSSPALAKCETSQVLLAGVPDVFSCFLGVLPFSSAY